MISAIGVAPNAPNDPLYRGSSRPDVMRLLQPLKPGLKILEIGCGEGAFCASIAGAAETWGIEPHPPSADIAATRLQRVLVCTFEAATTELPERHFDLIICNDVIEHMTDHDGFLRRVQRFMAPGARLVGSLPNVRFYGNLFNLVVARDWHYQNSGILDRTHFRFFTFRSLRRSLVEAGFDVHRLEGLNAGRHQGWSPRQLAERAFHYGLMALSGGAARDISYLQIGFVAAAQGSR
jgi:2-polyprenyl-3-methyl-5-hydroxy-6-metoxy-1,4-benzoquinol methylase